MGMSPGQGLTTGLSPIPLHNQSAYHNTTIDVIRKGCFGDFNTVACIRNGVLAALGALTALLCAVRVVQLHVRRHPTCHQYLIFYCAAIEATLGAVHWVLGRYAQLDFILQYLKLMQFLVMCHFYCILATRVLRKEAISRRFLMPMLIGALSYFTVVVILAVIHVQGSWLECLQAYWIELSAAEFILVQLFMVAGFYITRRLNEISTLDSVRWQQKRDLWCIIIVFEFSAFAGVLYDLTLLILGDEQTGCSGIFLHIQELYSAVFVTFMVVKLLLPIWVMLSVFHPLPPASDQEDLLPAMSEDGTYTSIFSPTVEDQYYRQLYHPSEDYRSTEDAPAGGGRQVLAHRTPSLTPIKEESQPHTPSAASDYTHSPKAAFYL